MVKCESTCTAMAQSWFGERMDGMKKISLIGNARYWGNVLTVIQGVLLVVVAIFLINQQYINEWRNYPNSSAAFTIYLKNIGPEKQSAVQRYLFNAADTQNLFITRQDQVLANNGTSGNIKIGVYGQTAGNDVSFAFMNQNILNADNLRKLLHSKSPDSTLGMETESVNSIGRIPGFRFYESIVIKKLPRLISDSNSVNGTYRVLGLHDDSHKAEFVSGLSAVSGMSEAELTAASGGMVTDSGFMLDIYLVFLAAQIFLNIVFFLVIAVKNLSKQGKLALLGWSRSAFAKEIFGAFLLGTIIEIPFLILFGWLLAGWNPISPQLLGLFLAASALNIVMVCIELAIASAVILLTKSLNAIRGRIPKKPLYVLGIIAYLMISAGIVFCGVYVDGPMKQLSDNAKLSRQWQAVSDYQILSNISVGQDAASISGQSNQLSQDFYHWYSSIAENNGVYLVHTKYIDSNLLADWRANKVYNVIPNQPFWNFAVSPNYLTKLGITVNESTLAKAKAGTRLYLLPDTLSEADLKQIEAYLREEATKNAKAGGIPTAFTKYQNFEFVTYKPTRNLFTWGTKTEDTMTDKAPVIYVATPENMTFFEDESLRAPGLESYIKFADAKTMAQYVSSDRLGQFNLTDNAPTFKPVQVYIDGLQKEIGTTILWFGLVFVILIAILIGLLLTLATIFRIANQEKINVKKFLGFDFWQLYRSPLILLSCVILLELGIVSALQSKFGLLLMAAVSLLQLLIFSKYMARSELKRLLLAFKGE